MNIQKSAFKIGKLSTIYMLGSILPKVLGLILLPVFTHYLVPEQFGIVRLALLIMQLMLILVQLGLWGGLKSHYFRTDQAVRPELVKTVLLGQVAQTGFLCMLLSISGVWLCQLLLPNLPLTPQKVFGLWLSWI